MHVGILGIRPSIAVISIVRKSSMDKIISHLSIRAAASGGCCIAAATRNAEESLVDGKQ